MLISDMVIDLIFIFFGAFYHIRGVVQQRPANQSSNILHRFILNEPSASAFDIGLISNSQGCAWQSQMLQSGQVRPVVPQLSL
jgi:hypothetical protein